MVYDKANELAKLLKESDEFREYKTTKEKAFENDTTASLIKEYHKLQLAAQAAMVSGKKDDDDAAPSEDRRAFAAESGRIRVPVCRIQAQQSGKRHI